MEITVTVLAYPAPPLRFNYQHRPDNRTLRRVPGGPESRQTETKKRHRFAASQLTEQDPTLSVQAKNISAGSANSSACFPTTGRTLSDSRSRRKGWPHGA